jgi:nitronate monooxygenase
MLALLSEVHRHLGLAPPVLPPVPPDRFAEELDAVLAARPAAFSFTFGVPSAEQMTRLRGAGIFTMGTATTVEEARILKDAGVDAVVAQGEEAGAHRGTFAGPFEAAMVPVAELVREIAPMMPVIAAGGIMDGRDIVRMLELGASAVQMGTAFLACPESGAADAYKRAILEASSDTTEITRAFSGRPARGLRNAFMQLVRGREEIILPFPVQNAMTRTMRAAAGAKGDREYLSLWAGRGVARTRALPAGELVRRLVSEISA